MVISSVPHLRISYNPGGQRVSKGTITKWSCDPAISGFTATNDYVLGPGGEQVTEMAMNVNKTMAWQHTNVYAAGNLFATYDNNGLHFHLNDELGTRRVQTDYAGVMEQTCSGLPFGDSLDCSNSIQFPTEHHFTGKERDTESGNDYFGARYYTSTMGRFLSPDWSAKAQPVPYAKPGNPQTLNLYGYMQNNPLGGVDRDGHCDWCQKLLNAITGNGFQTNALLAAENARTTITDTETYTPLTNPEPESAAEPKEPNEAVALGADAVGLASATPGVLPGVPGLALGLAAGSVSSVNDPRKLNLSINLTGGALGVTSFLMEGTAVGTGATVGAFGVGVGALAWDASNWVSNNAITPVFTPDANQSVNINANGYTIPAPDAYDWHQP